MPSDSGAEVDPKLAAGLPQTKLDNNLEGLTERGRPMHRQAAFRGRRVVSSFLPVPAGYQGLVFSTAAPLPPPPPSSSLLEVDLAAKKSSAAREERSAKRAKLAENGSSGSREREGRVKGLAEGQEGMRRSPRKAAAEARARAVAAAKTKAKGGKGQGKAQARKELSLDSDEEQEQVGEEMVKAEEQETVVEVELQETTLKVDVDETVMVVDGESVSSTVEESISTVTITGTTTVESNLSTESSSSTAGAGPAPLSRTSSSLLLSTTPLPSASLLSTPSSSFISISDGPLARDEKHLVPVLTFERFEVWNPDFPIAGGRVAEEDDVARAVVEWVGVAAKLVTVGAGKVEGGVKDTTGAGDCFTGFFATLLSTLTPTPPSAPPSTDKLKKILSIACQAAAMCVENPGAMESVPSLEDVKQRMGEKWAEGQEWERLLQ